MVNHQLAQANEAVWMFNDALHCQHVSIGDKLKTYTQRVVTTVLHGSGAWVWAQGLVTRLHAGEGLSLRKITGFERRGDETWVRYHRRTLIMVRRAFICAGHLPLTMRVLMNICSLAISLFREPNYEIMRMANGVVLWTAENSS